MSYAKSVENSILNEFKQSIWEPFLDAIERYELIQKGDNIAVCISGGKDSMLLALLTKMLKEQGIIDFNVKYLVMDPGYNAINRQKIIDNAKKLEIPIEVFNSDIFEIANGVGKSPCYLCARMRRGHLYANAQSRGCTKIALGHHFSDVIETTMIGMFYGSQLQAMLPKLHSTNFEGMELIRPLYLIHEDDIIKWRDFNSLDFIQCACRFTENISNSHDGVGNSKRQEIKVLIRDLKKTNPNIEQSIFDSINNVKLDGVIGYKTDSTEHSFIERL